MIKFSDRLNQEVSNMTRVLIVDDDWILGEDLIGQVEDLGYEVAGRAVSGEEGIRMALDLVRPAWSITNW